MTTTVGGPVRAPRPVGLRLDAGAWIAVGAGGVWLLLGLLSRGFLWQDEYAHLLFSRGVWSHPSVVVDLWGRPLATMVYAVPALAGIWLVRLVTVVLAVLAVWWTGRAAAKRGLPAPVAALAVAAQPVFASFAFGALPGTLFAALLARMLLEDARGRQRAAAVCAALLPLARVEGVLIVAVYAVALLRRGRVRTALVPFGGLAVWNAAGWALTGSPLFLLTANPYPVVGSIYPTAGFAYLGRVLPVAAGVAVFLLVQAGVVATIRRAGLVHALAAVGGGFLILVWGIPLFASTPTPVYLLGFAPLLALLAAEGWRWIRRAPPVRLRALAVVVLLEAFVLVPHRTAGSLVRALASPVAGAERLAVAAAFAIVALALLAAGRRPRALAAALVLAAGLHVATVAGPVPASPHERAAARAAAWVDAHAGNRPVVSMAPDVLWFADADPFHGWRPGSLPAEIIASGRLPADALLVWDPMFAPREGAMSLEALRADGWRELTRIADGRVEMVVLDRR